MRVLVCGDRYWTDVDLLFSTLDAFHAAHNVTCVIEGEARGADRLAGLWGRQRNITVRKYPALWEVYGKAAGPIRNQQMLDEGQPEYVIAFHDSLSTSKGTADMVRRAKRDNLPVLVVKHG